MLNVSDEIKNQISMSDVLVMHGIHLHNNFCCCPFHNEKTPSFSVYKDNKRYHCFGCGESGDVITFVMKYYNISFKEALQKLDTDFNLGLTNKNMSPAEYKKMKAASEARAEALKKKKEKEEYHRYAYDRLCSFRRWLASQPKSLRTEHDISYIDGLLDYYINDYLIDFDVDARIREVYFKYRIKDVN